MKAAILAVLSILLAPICLGQSTWTGSSTIKGNAALTVGAVGTFTGVQVVANFSGASVTTFNLTVASTGSNNLLVLQSQDTNSGNYITSVTTGCSGTWQVPASAQQSNAGNSVSGAYCLASSSGVTSITINFNNSRPYHFVFYEVSDTAGHSPSLDPSGGIGTAAYSATTNPSGVTLTLSGANDAVFQQIAAGGGTVTAISAPYGNFNNLSALGQGWGNVLNNSTGTAPTWTNSTSAAGSISAMAFSAN